MNEVSKWRLSRSLEIGHQLDVHVAVNDYEQISAFSARYQGHVVTTQVLVLDLVHLFSLSQHNFELEDEFNGLPWPQVTSLFSLITENVFIVVVHCEHALENQQFQSK